jgi:hypothetical protein
LGVAGTHLPSDSSAFAAAVIGELAAVWGIAEKVAQDEALSNKLAILTGIPGIAETTTFSAWSQQGTIPVSRQNTISSFALENLGKSPLQRS